jgi:hypothetical protein
MNRSLACLISCSLGACLGAQTPVRPEPEGVPQPPPLLVAGLPNPDYAQALASIVTRLSPEDRRAFFRLLRTQQRELQTRLEEMAFNRERALSLRQSLDKEGSGLARQAGALGDAQERAIRQMRGMERAILAVRRDFDPQTFDAEALQADFYAGFQFSTLYRDPTQNAGFFAKSKPFVSLDIRQTFRWPARDQWVQFFGTLSFQSSSKEKSDTVDVITTSGSFRGEMGAWWMKSLTDQVSFGLLGSMGLVGYSVQEENPDLTASGRDEFRNRARLGLTLRQEEGALRGSLAEIAYVRDPQFVHMNRLLFRGRVLITQFGSTGSSGDFYMEGFVSKGRGGRDEAVLLVGLRLSTLSFFRSLGWTGVS